MFDRLDRFHKTNQGYATFFVLELLAAYLLASAAIDTGSLWIYAAAIVISIGALINLTYLLESLAGKKGRAKSGK